MSISSHSISPMLSCGLNYGAQELMDSCEGKFIYHAVCHILMSMWCYIVLRCHPFAKVRVW